MEQDLNSRKIKQIKRFVEYRTSFAPSDISSSYAEGYVKGVNYVKDEVLKIIKRK